jgi:hypothetical protein
MLVRNLLAASIAFLPLSAGTVPSDPQRLVHTISYGEMEAFLKEVARPGLITVTEEARSHEGRAVYLVHLNRGGAKARFKVLFYAQQHGDEISGKDAQLCMVQAIAERPALLPEDVDLYLMPMVNPDGAEAGRRTNGIKADLNRDHILLQQPETQALHRVAQRIRPHLAVDSHEFTRDGKDWDAQGWDCWPLITLDGLNAPWIPGYLKREALATVESARPVMAKAGFPYTRYTVGGLPPLDEIRPSTTEMDDGRNSIGCMGALSFIIEAGVKRQSGPDADLGRRAAAYTRLYRHLLGTPASRRRVEALCARARVEPLPRFTATNFFWASLDGSMPTVRVTERATGKPLDIPAPGFMTDLVVKASVPTPSGYVIEARAAGPFKALLDHHGIQYRVLGAPESRMAEACRLDRVEPAYDELYGRYGNRQIVHREPAASHLFPEGSLVVSLAQPLARNALGVLEPCLLYGLYSYKDYTVLALPDGTLPVWRLP